MKPSDVLDAQVKILAIGKMAETIDLDGFLEQISLAECEIPKLHKKFTKGATSNLIAMKNLAKVTLDLKNTFAQTIMIFNQSIKNGHDKLPVPINEN